MMKDLQVYQEWGAFSTACRPGYGAKVFPIDIPTMARDKKWVGKDRTVVGAAANRKGRKTGITLGAALLFLDSLHHVCCDHHTRFHLNELTTEAMIEFLQQCGRIFSLQIRKNQR